MWDNDDLQGAISKPCLRKNQTKLDFLPKYKIG